LDGLNVDAATIGDWLDDDDDESEEDSDSGYFPLHKDNVDALRVFMATWTQWRVVAVKHVIVYLGIDYACLPEVWMRLKIKPKRRDKVFEQLRTVEAELIQVRNAKQK